jgi:o-succinylbenzoate synthase
VTAIIRKVNFKSYVQPPHQSIVNGQKIEERPGWHVRIETNESTVGMGDIAPWPGFSRPATAIEPTLERIALQLQDAILPNMANLDAWTKKVSLDPVVCHGVELAVLDIIGQKQDLPISALFASEVLAEVSCHALVSNQAEAKRAFEAGAEVLKVKIGNDHQTDLRRLAAIRAAVPTAKLRLDVNGAWKTEEAHAYVNECLSVEPSIIEQPVAAHEFDALSMIADKVACDVSADESMVLNAERTLQIHPLSEVVLKPMFLGGLCRTANLVKKAQVLGFSVCITHALESNVGRLGALHLAAAVGGQATHGLGGMSEAVGGRLAVPKTPGLGEWC